MTKSHRMHRKKAIHMKFRRSAKVRRSFWHVSGLFEKVRQKEKV